LLYVLILGERAAENEVLLCGFPQCDRRVIGSSFANFDAHLRDAVDTACVGDLE
jgi:hypothetical protein